MAANQDAKLDSEEEGCPPTKKVHTVLYVVGITDQWCVAHLMQRKRGNKERNPDFTQQMHAETSYYIKNGAQFM